jgi:hypothetical protein
VQDHLYTEYLTDLDRDHLADSARASAWDKGTAYPRIDGFNGFSYGRLQTREIRYVHLLLHHARFCVGCLFSMFSRDRLVWVEGPFTNSSGITPIQFTVAVVFKKYYSIKILKWYLFYFLKFIFNITISKWFKNNKK